MSMRPTRMTLPALWTKERLDDLGCHSNFKGILQSYVQVCFTCDTLPYPTNIYSLTTTAIKLHTRHTISLQNFCWIVNELWKAALSWFFGGKTLDDIVAD